MHIEKRTPDLLVLADAGAGIRLFGTIFLTAGAIMLWDVAHSATWRAGPVVFGPLFALIGAACIVLPARVVAAFDRRARTLTITRRTLRGYTRDEVALDRITDVIAAVSPGPSRSATWRVEVVLRDGTHLPLTHSYSNSPLNAQAAKAAEDFLGLTPSPEAAALRARFAGRAPTRGSLVTGMVFCSLFVVVGFWMLYSEWTQLTFYRPVPARVLSSGYVTVHGSKGGVSYRPAITFEYEVGGRSYQSRHATVLNESRGGDWAFGIMNRFPSGAETTAWYDPGDPSKALLLHEWSLFPLIFLAIPLAIMVMFARMLRQMKTADHAGNA